MNAKLADIHCDYCGQVAKLVSGEKIYPHRKDLWRLDFYLCAPCDAYVGCHKGSYRPLGRLADAFLRVEKSKAHAAFDPLWKSRKMTRGAAYKWLAEQLSISKDECHIGMFSAVMCRRVVEICNKR